MLSKVSKSIQKSSLTSQVTPVRILIFLYRLQSSLLPGASAATTNRPIILSKLKLKNPHSKSSPPLHDTRFSQHATNFHCRVEKSSAFMQFSKEPTSQNFGDLPRGEIPAPLQYNRPYRKYLL